MTTTTGTLLDEILPEFDFRSRHARRVEAPPDWVAQALEYVRPGRAASLLLRLRGLRLPAGSIRELLTGLGFAVLAERPGTEIVLGTTGRFWRLREETAIERPADVQAFRAFDRPGWAQGAMSFRIEPLGDGSTLLTTETRVRGVDEAARRRFAVYWSLIGVFSGWLRQDLLRRIARIAEGVE
ncbi:MAG TPA: hypothetical protein VHL78_03240 [Actinomycetota bacterium]|nr:hypothetical protein [Actinomycetota bacterium]